MIYNKHISNVLLFCFSVTILFDQDGNITPDAKTILHDDDVMCFFLYSQNKRKRSSIAVIQYEYVSLDSSADLLKGDNFHLLSLMMIHILCFTFLYSENKWSSIAVIYYEYGSLVLTYSSIGKAVNALKLLEEGICDHKKLLVLLLPNIQVSLSV